MYPNLPLMRDPEPERVWRKIKQEWQKHSELQRHVKTNMTKKMIFKWGDLPKFRIMHVPIKFPPTLYFLHLHQKKGPAPCCYATVASVWFSHSHKQTMLFSQQNQTGQAELQAASVPQPLWHQPHSFITSFGISLCKKAGHRKPQAREKQDSCFNRALLSSCTPPWDQGWALLETVEVQVVLRPGQRLAKQARECVTAISPSSI